jgi:hypothetical protein
MSTNFLKEYHSTVVKAAGENAKNLNTKMGIIMANKWVDNTAKFDNNKEFGDFFERYLKELEFAENVNVHCDEQNYTISINGCAICHGNEILRQEGIGTVCPIVQTAKYAMVKKMGRNVVIKGIDKPGPVGECTIRFELE